MLLFLMFTKCSLSFPSCARINRKLHSLCRNGQWFFFSKPPTVLFLVNLAIITVVLSSIGMYVKVSDNIRISNAWQDWNMFLDSFSKLELCIIHPSNLTSKIIGNALPQNTIPKLKKSTNLETFHFSIELAMHPSIDFLKISNSYSHLSTAMFGKYIGLKGDDSTALLNVTVIFPNDWPRNFCSPNPFQTCLDLNINACIRFVGPKSMFPHSGHKTPSMCKLNYKKLQSDQHYYAGLNWQVPNIDSAYYCRSRTTLRIQHNDDPNLSVPILKAYRANILRHLNRVVLFLVIILLFVFIYASCFNHQSHIELTDFYV